MRRAVLDSNVLVSALAFPASVPGRIVAVWKKEAFVLIISQYIIKEVARTLIDKIKVPSDFVVPRLMALYEASEVVEPSLVMDANADEQDWPILGTALAGRADFLVTGDKKILTLRNFDSIAIVTPRDFLDLF